ARGSPEGVAVHAWRSLSNSSAGSVSAKREAGKNQVGRVGGVAADNAAASREAALEDSEVLLVEVA
ncbi:hypothetical protein, partial [Pseudomonas aeruginosa]